MSEVNTTAFTSASDFKNKLVNLFKGPTFYSAFSKLDKKLTRKIIIAVSIANNCVE